MTSVAKVCNVGIVRVSFEKLSVSKRTIFFLFFVCGCVKSMSRATKSKTLWQETHEGGACACIMADYMRKFCIG